MDDHPQAPPACWSTSSTRRNEESMVAVGVVPWHINVRLNDTMRTAWEGNGWAVYLNSKNLSEALFRAILLQTARLRPGRCR